MGAFRQFLIDERFTIPIGIDELDKKLLFAENEDFDVQGIGDYAYQFVDNQSYRRNQEWNRTKILSSYAVVDTHLTEVLLYTTLNWGLVALAIGLAIALLACLTSSATIDWELYLILPCVLLGAWFFVRLQEYILLQKVIKYLTALDLPSV